MYICQITKKTSKPGAELHKIVVEKRSKTYYTRVKNEETNRWEDVEIGRGWEIVREVNVSAEGLAIWHAFSDQDKENWTKNYSK